MATGLFPGDAGAAARAALAALTNAGAGGAGAGASRMTDGPAIPLDHSPREKRPAAPTLRGRTIAVLEALPRRPSIAALCDVTYEGLQALMRANDIPRRTHGGVPDLLAAVLSWLSAHPDAELCLPRGLSRRTARRDGRASTPPRAAPGAGAPPEHLFGPPFPGHSPPPERSPRENSAGPPWRAGARRAARSDHAAVVCVGGPDYAGRGR